MILYRSSNKLDLSERTKELIRLAESGPFPNILCLNTLEASKKIRGK